MTDRVVTSRKAGCYHADQTCPGWLQGRNNSVQLGRELHPVLAVTEAEVIRLRKRKCTRCGGGA